MSFSAIFLAATPATQEPSAWFVAALGITVVMLGLICIILICSLMGAICSRVLGKDKPAVTSDTTKPAATAAVPAPIPNKCELIAAITAAIAEDLGTDVSAIRIHSLRSLSAAVPARTPDKNELVAAIASAIAEDLGTDVSALRIHSVRQIG